MRKGKGKKYGKIGEIKKGVGIMVEGWKRGYGWCKV